jgi:hypothetical protein
MSFETTFTAEVWRWDAREKDSWFFVSLPGPESEHLGALPRPPRGFGSIPVTVRIGSSTWQTSVFPDSKSGRYVLPLKASVRTREGIDEGGRVQVDLIVRSGSG